MQMLQMIHETRKVTQDMMRFLP